MAARRACNVSGATSPYSATRPRIWLALALLDFGDIERGQRRIKVNMQALRIARLGIGQTGKLFGVAKDKFDLKARFIQIEKRHRIQVQIGRKQQRIARRSSTTTTRKVRLSEA